MWSVTMSPAVAVAMAEEQTRAAMTEVRRPRRTRTPRSRSGRSGPSGRSSRAWFRGLQGRAA